MTRHTHVLKEVTRFELFARQPFNFQYTFWKPSHFRTGLEVHNIDTSWRSFICGDKPLGLRFDYDGSKILVRVFADWHLTYDEESSLKDRIVQSYGLNEDITNFLSVAASRSATANAVRLFGGMRMSCPESIFEISLLAVLLQNTTISRTEQMLDLLLTAYGSTLEFNGIRLKCFFPPMRLVNVTPDELRQSCKLGYRAPTILAIAHHFARCSEAASGYVSRNSKCERLLQEELMEIRGIGPFTASVVASHALRQMNEPALDVWNTRIVARYLGMNEQANRCDVQSQLMLEYPGWAALALLYIVEAECAGHPIVTLTT